MRDKVSGHELVIESKTGFDSEEAGTGSYTVVLYRDEIDNRLETVGLGNSYIPYKFPCYNNNNPSSSILYVN